MGNTHLDWPSDGPTIWLAKWEELINKAERYNENLPIWLRDVCLVWEQVPDLTSTSAMSNSAFENIPRPSTLLLRSAPQSIFIGSIGSSARR